MTETTQLNLPLARQRRDAGIAKVAAHNPNWEALAIQEIKWLRSARTTPNTPKYGQTFLFENLVHYLEAMYGKIPNPNLAGALAKKAVSMGYIEKTGQWKQTEDPEKHAREARVYKWKAR